MDCVTQNTHLGLYRNCFGQDIDDVLLADNECSANYQCTPAATHRGDSQCPTHLLGVAPGTDGAPADVQMSAADVAYDVAWETPTDTMLKLALNSVGACSAPSTARQPSAIRDGIITDPGASVTDADVNIDPTAADSSGFVIALLAAKSSFN